MVGCKLISAVILDDENRILVQDHVKASKLTPVGGKVNQGESPFDAVAREIMEETGLEPANYQVVGFYQNNYSSSDDHGIEGEEFMFSIRLLNGEPVNMEPKKHIWQEFKTLTELEELKPTRPWGAALENAVKHFPQLAK